MYMCVNIILCVYSNKPHTSLVTRIQPFIHICIWRYTLSYTCICQCEFIFFMGRKFFPYVFLFLLELSFIVVLAEETNKMTISVVTYIMVMLMVTVLITGRRVSL